MAVACLTAASWIQQDPKYQRVSATSPEPEAAWFALQVRCRHEKRVDSLLANRGYESLLPLSKALSHSQSRRQPREALFPGYLFCRFNAKRRLGILTTPGVIGIVGIGKIPVPLYESEIDAIQRIAASDLSVQPWPPLQLGVRVRIERGPLAGIEGVVVRFKDHYKLVVAIVLLQRSIAVDVGRESVRPV
jgi:transcription antitermination factor NusG